MLTFSTSEDTKSLKIANVREIAIAYTIRSTGRTMKKKSSQKFKIFKDSQFQIFQISKKINLQKISNKRYIIEQYTLT